MDETPKPERNPKTHQAHRREVFLQITLPLIIGMIIALALAVLAVVAATSDGNIKQAGDAALIFLIIPLMFVTVLFTLIFSALAYGIIRLNGTLPFYTKQAQDVMEQVRRQVQVGSDKAVEPILKIRSFLASLGAIKPK
jgi:predicted PurR-regulated permease PerM